jgi:YfiH family protein
MWKTIDNKILQHELMIQLEIRHFVSMKPAGNMNDVHLRNMLVSSLNINPSELVTAEQVHDKNVHKVTHADAGTTVITVDGLLTETSGVPMGIRTADCVPVFIFDKNKTKAAVLHSGWRSLNKGIIELGLAGFVNPGTKISKQDVIVVIGPHICAACYKVNDDVGKLFPSNYKNGSLNLQNEIKNGLLTAVCLKRIFTGVTSIARFTSRISFFRIGTVI